LSRVEEQSKGKTLSRTFRPVTLEDRYFGFIPSVNLFRLVSLHAGRWISIGPAQCHRISDQGSDALKQYDACSRLARQFADNDINVLTRHLIDTSMTVVFEEAIDHPSIVGATGS
jgi:hypothetical protein